MTAPRPRHLQPVPTRPDLLTVIEVAAKLRVAKMSIYRLVQTGELPHIRVGRSIRIKAADLDQFVRQHTSGWSA